MPGTVKTTRLRKCECAGCGYVARVSRTWLQRGLLACPCGGQLVPTDLDDVLGALDAGYVTAADLETHAEYVTYTRAAASAARGQAGRSAKWGAVAADGTPWQTPEEIALVKVRAIRDLAAHDARHAALAAHAFGGPKTEDPIPF
jgi:hypothetical protein